MTADHSPVLAIAREYLRVSSDPAGRARSVAEQHGDNERAGEQHGFRLNGESYSDVSVSASRYATKVRGDFGRLMADLREGRFGAGVLVLWESSRGSRKVGEWVDLVEACEAAGVRIHVTTHGRTYDPAGHRDRRSLLEDAVDSEYESGKTSDRIVRSVAANAADGRPHGKAPFGYRRTYEVLPSGRRVILAQEPEPAEAAVVRELLTRLRRGHSLSGIAGDFGARGIRGRGGKPFSRQQLRDMALRPAYAGLRLHRPGRRSDHRGSLDGAVTATWPALVDAETFLAVREILTGRSMPGRGRGAHLLGMIARCGVCAGPLTAKPVRGERCYQCRERSCVRIGADDLDAYAEAVMLAYLARDDVIEQLRAGEQDDAALAAARTEVAGARAELAQLRADGRARRITVATITAVEPGLVAAVEDAERRERELTAPPVLAGLIEPGKDVARRWEDAPMPARRQVARILCSPAILGVLNVGRSPVPGRRAPASERVSWGRD